MSDDLHEALTEIDGIGDARAEEILDVIDDHGRDDEELRQLLGDAVDHHRAGKHVYASKFARRARALLEDDG